MRAGQSVARSTVVSWTCGCATAKLIAPTTRTRPTNTAVYTVSQKNCASVIF